MLLILRKQFENSCLKHATDDPGAWIMDIEEVYNQMDEISLCQAITDEYFMLHVIGTLQKSIK